MPIHLSRENVLGYFLQNLARPGYHPFVCIPCCIVIEITFEPLLAFRHTILFEVLIILCSADTWLTSLE